MKTKEIINIKVQRCVQAGIIDKPQTFFSSWVSSNRSLPIILMNKHKNYFFYHDKIKIIL